MFLLVPIIYKRWLPIL